MSLGEILIGFVLIVSTALTSGLVWSKLGTSKEALAVSIAAALGGSLLIWGIIHGWLVREGFIHPIGTIEDGKKHTTDCPCQH